MSLLGQASGNWTESSSMLRILNAGIKNSVGILTDDSFTQTNPPIVTTASTISDKAQTLVFGVLSGSVAFLRPDAGGNYIGGPATVAASGISSAQAALLRPLGCFINNAVGRPFENTPGVASGKGPYCSAQGTYGNQLYETQALATAGAYTAGDDLTYTTGMPLMASANGYLMPGVDSAGASLLASNNSLEIVNSAIGGTSLMGFLKAPADSTMSEIIYDQRV